MTKRLKALFGSNRTWQLAFALAAVAVVVYIADDGRWPFDSDPRPLKSHEDPSVWQFLFSDSTVLGYVRLALMAFSLYVIASVIALVVAGRWLRGFGTGGMSADDVRTRKDASATLEAWEKTTADLKEKARIATEQAEKALEDRDEARNALRNVVEGRWTQ